MQESIRTQDTNPSLADRNAVLSRLFAEHHRRLFHFILSKVRSADDSADLVDQAFAEACKAFGTFRGESELPTWLYGIAVNLVRNHLSRSPQWRYEFGTDELLEDMPDSSRDIPQAVDSKRLMQRLHGHLGTLPSSLRQTLLMVTVDEMSYEEAARQLDIPVGTVRSRISRCRAVLKQRLLDDGIPMNMAI